LETTALFDKKESSRHIKAFIRNIYEWVESFISALLVLIFVLGIIFRMFTVIGSSMNPTLSSEDRVIAFNLFYTPQRGDIVAITQPRVIHVEESKPLIKRVIGVEGDIVKIDFERGIVYVNDEALEEDYILEPTMRRGNMESNLPVTVRKGYVFVMGDNRNDSLDSRYDDIGQIDVRYIVGGMFFRYWPFDGFDVMANPYNK
jgi:signal peptidase I